MLAFGFWIKHCALSNWSPLWDNLHTITGSVPGVEEVFEEIDGHPEYLITFQLPLPINTEAIQYHLEDLPFQRKDLDSCIIAPLYNELIQQFINSWFIIATAASKSPFITSIAGCKATSQFSYRVHTVNYVHRRRFSLDELCLFNCHTNSCLSQI